MYSLDWDIKVGNYRLKLIDSVKVTRSVEQLSDTAQVVLPGTVFNRAIEVEDYLKVGDPVEIRLGYDGELETEFKGYLKSIKTDDGSITLECEDELYQWDKAVNDKEYKKVKLSALLEDVASQIGSGYTVQCDFDFTYDKFNTYRAKGLDVLKKVQEETKANIWFDGQTLHVQPQYAQASGQTVMFDFAKNIESSDLKYRKKADRDIEVEVTLNLPDGRNITQKIGTPGGKSVKEVVSGYSEDSVKTVASNIYDKLCFDGYEGSFTGWLVPYVKPTDSVSLHDADYETKNGTYYVIGTELSFSKDGGKRTVKLGRKL